MIATMFRKLSVFLLAVAAIFASEGGVPCLAVPSPEVQSSFDSPQEAVESLVAAVRNNDQNALLGILGPDSSEIVSSGDPVADKGGRERFARLYGEQHSIEKAGADKAILSFGEEDFPFPIPLIKKNDKWIFDAKAGKEEILNRRIGRNELEAIEMLRTYVDAQREYASMKRDGGGSNEFAQRISSTPGKSDGLYWDAKNGVEESPLGPLAAKAAMEGYSTSKSGKPTPYHGYLFRILKAQGESAEGGAYDYVVNGKMVLGFAMVACPGQYGSSGIMTFIVNQNGTVYQKDLGKNTGKVAAAMKNFNPDKSWTKVD